jgi:ATP-dependent Lon protease
MDADKSGGRLGLPMPVALCGSVLGKNIRGETIIVGGRTLGGSIDMISNAIRIAEPIDKQAQALLMQVSAHAVY